MNAPTIRFDDGAAYERYMGVWSQRVGMAFLDWLAPAPGLRWLDVGCGNGAFTEQIVARCAPASVDGIDPSAAQLNHARTRPTLADAAFREGDAMALPYPDDTFDVAVMPLVIFFVPDPARGVAEMARVVRAGGIVAAYAWDMPGGGFPYEPLLAELRASGVIVPSPPSPDASTLDSMRAYWTEAGLGTVETRVFDVERRFADFDEYWTTVRAAPSAGPMLGTMTTGEREALQQRVRARLAVDGDAIVCTARANAVRGSVARKA
ncbi:MAG: methyltransferase domain-containing protein [Xanthomonadales bacterium]|nr:methyltransferase domain-containing protein [Xanthomonadales bacterium]